MLKDLIQLANHLDRKKLTKEADILDEVIFKIASQYLDDQDELLGSEDIGEGTPNWMRLELGDKTKDPGGIDANDEISGLVDPEYPKYRELAKEQEEELERLKEEVNAIDEDIGWWKQHYTRQFEEYRSDDIPEYINAMTLSILDTLDILKDIRDNEDRDENARKLAHKIVSEIEEERTILDNSVLSKNVKDLFEMLAELDPFFIDAAYGDDPIPYRTSNADELTDLVEQFIIPDEIVQSLNGEVIDYVDGLHNEDVLHVYDLWDTLMQAINRSQDAGKKMADAISNFNKIMNVKLSDGPLDLEGKDFREQLTHLDEAINSDREGKQTRWEQSMIPTDPNKIDTIWQDSDLTEWLVP